MTINYLVMSPETGMSKGVLWNRTSCLDMIKGRFFFFIKHDRKFICIYLFLFSPSVNKMQT